MPECGEPYGRMLDADAARDCLKRSGARMTAQRRAVLAVLESNRTHPTAEEIAVRVQDRLGCVAPATIYNTLESLQELGFVRRIDGLEQRAHFDPDTSDHAHAVCANCRRVWDLAEPVALTGLPDGFRVDDVLVQGTCDECKSK